MLVTSVQSNYVHRTTYIFCSFNAYLHLINARYIKRIKVRHYYFKFQFPPHTIHTISLTRENRLVQCVNDQ